MGRPLSISRKDIDIDIDIAGIVGLWVTNMDIVSISAKAISTPCTSSLAKSV